MPVSPSSANVRALNIGELLTIDTLDSLPRQQSLHSPTPISSNTVNYKLELARLLSKSNGTAYEATLKKFLEAKILEEAEINRSPSSRSLSPGSPIPSNRKESSSHKQNILNVIRSNINSGSRNSRSASPSSPSIHGDQRVRDAQLALPLERNKWVPCNIFERASTNHLGRQRPPTRSQSPHANLSSIKSASLPVNESYQQQKQSATITSAEFRKWVKNTEKWQIERQERIKRLKIELDYQRVASAPSSSSRCPSPKLQSPSRESAARRGKVSDTTVESQLDDDDDDLAGIALIDSPSVIAYSAAPRGRSDKVDVSNNADPSHVFSRLYSSSRDRSSVVSRSPVRSLFPRSRSASATRVSDAEKPTFTPHIDSYSRELVAKARERERLQREAIAAGGEEEKSALGARAVLAGRRSSSPASRKAIPQWEAVQKTTKLGFGSSTPRKTAVVPYMGSRSSELLSQVQQINPRLSVHTSVRARSASPSTRSSLFLASYERAIGHSKPQDPAKRPKRKAPPPPKTAPHKPKIIETQPELPIFTSNGSELIMANKGTTLQERLDESISQFHMKRILADRAILDGCHAPAIGQYQPSGECDVARGRGSIFRESSPGRQGYSFGMAARGTSTDRSRVVEAVAVPLRASPRR